MIFGVPAWLEEEGRGEGKGRGRGEGKGRGRGEGKEQRAESRELRAVARGKPPEASGKQLTARGKEQRAESRELREVARGKPEECGNAGMHECVNKDGTGGQYARGKPPSARGMPPGARGKPLTARGQPPVARDRGHPPEVEFDVFHRANLPEMGEVCTGNRGTEQVNQSHQLNSNTVPLATFTC
jgi:hypothetical protein